MLVFLVIVFFGNVSYFSDLMRTLLPQIEVASSCSDLYNIVGETYWVATRCDSMVSQG
jgi:hypothetical protein